jgi:predicted transport protein
MDSSGSDDITEQKRLIEGIMPMSDMRLFRVGEARIKELERRSGSIEKALQTLIESNLDTLLGIRMIASEYTHPGLDADPIDTLGIDENGAPVVIKYKRAPNENVVTQGLYYLDWLGDHRELFESLVRGVTASSSLPQRFWPAKRLVCIAGDFNRFDRHAAVQMQRNIDLIDYCQFDIGFLMLSLAATSADPAVAVSSGADADSATARLEEAPRAIFELFQALSHFTKALGDDVQIQALLHEFAFRRMKTFAWTVVQPKLGKIQLQLPIDADTVALEAGFSRQAQRSGLPGGALELTLNNPEDLEKAKALITRSYRQH